MKNAQANNERREVFFSGRVQGVGFRYTVYRLAAGGGVTGYVRNLADGRVHMVAEGLPEAIDRLLQRVVVAMRDNIHEAETTRGDATGAFEGFTIR